MTVKHGFGSSDEYEDEGFIIHGRSKGADPRARRHVGRTATEGSGSRASRRSNAEDRKDEEPARLKAGPRARTRSPRPKDPCERHQLSRGDDSSGGEARVSPDMADLYEVSWVWDGSNGDSNGGGIATRAKGVQGNAPSLTPLSQWESLRAM